MYVFFFSFFFSRVKLHTAYTCRTYCKDNLKGAKTERQKITFNVKNVLHGVSSAYLYIKTNKHKSQSRGERRKMYCINNVYV